MSARLPAKDTVKIYELRLSFVGKWLETIQKVKMALGFILYVSYSVEQRASEKRQMPADATAKD